ncbi:hypothetical protein A9Z42_0017060 [Trichoderma parareesei]|uniref:FAD/NAD(P)-binding domain-containing protein n=1 Tax=Trichoderma parareesei TaxID=858221 RepID=A0A2H2YZV4_TRIPA|nr:hypothetical protein A9Z42_0017060 [Trichoderma parareesei]
MSTHYDAIIIGSGQGGTPLSMAFANAQHKTALIESSHVGGCCVNEGCTPTKTMVASGRVGYLARRGPQYGIFTGDQTDSAENDIRVEMKVVRQRKRDIVDRFRSGSESRIRETGVNLIFGTACFKDERTVHVRTVDGPKMNLTADRVFICSGERPAIPKIDGFDVAAFPPGILLDSTTIQELGVVPSHLVVIGGGYIGLEFGQLFRRLGAAVTIVQRGAQLLPREDTDVAEAMLGVLKEDGVRVLLNATPTSIRPAGDEDSTTAAAVLVTVSGQGSLSELQASHVLFAAGRVPNTEMLNLGAAGIETTARGHIITDAQLRTTNRHVWALGDVKGGPAFTHVSYDDFRLLRTNLLESGNLTVGERLVPYVVYTDPQLGHVGLHEHEARC